MRARSFVGDPILDQLARLNADIEEAMKHAKTLENQYRVIERTYRSMQVLPRRPLRRETNLR